MTQGDQVEGNRCLNEEEWHKSQQDLVCSFWVNRVLFLIVVFLLRLPRFSVWFPRYLLDGL